MRLYNNPGLKRTILIPATIFLFCYIITLSPLYTRHPGLLSTALSGDLLITAPLLYFYAVRKTSISNVTTLRVVLAGIIVAGFILEKNQSGYLPYIQKWLMPLIESLLIFFIIRRFYIASKAAKRKDNYSPDFLYYSRALLADVTGSSKAANIIASEIAVFYYALFSRKTVTDNQVNFSSYKKNGIISLLATFLCLFIIETTVVHFLLMRWNIFYAWIIFALSIYTCLQLFSHIRAIKYRVIKVEHNQLELHMGLAADAIIDLKNIESITHDKKTCNEIDHIKIALIKGLENHNIILRLKEPIEVIRMFGIKKQTNTILFFADQPEELIRVVKKSSMDV